MFLPRELCFIIRNLGSTSKLIKQNPSKYLCRNLSIFNQKDAKISFKLSDIGEGIREVVVKDWLVQVGDKVSQFDEICEVQSDKASVTITSRYDGIIMKLHYEIDQVAVVGKPLYDIEIEDEENVEAAEHVQRPSPQATIVDCSEISKDANVGVLCIPSVRRLAKEHQLDLTQVKGTGKGGRILKEDILKFLSAKEELTPPSKPQQPQSGDRTEAVKGFQKAMAKTMTAALKIPHFVYGDEIKTSNLSKLRQTLKQSPQHQNLKLSFLPFFIKAASQALHQYPIINAVLDEFCENVTYRSEHNIGVAVDTNVGLAVPVIKNVEQLSIIEISNELNRLVVSGRDGTFSAQDLAGGTFTVSNIGAIGGTYMTPIIMPPQAALMALGSAQLLPRFDASKNIIAEEILNVSAVADHRIIDGATMARFIQTIKRQIENPHLLFLNL